MHERTPRTFSYYTIIASLYTFYLYIFQFTRARDLSPLIKIESPLSQNSLSLSLLLYNKKNSIYIALRRLTEQDTHCKADENIFLNTHRTQINNNNNKRPRLMRRTQMTSSNYLSIFITHIALPCHPDRHKGNSSRANQQSASVSISHFSQMSCGGNAASGGVRARRRRWARDILNCVMESISNLKPSNFVLKHHTNKLCCTSPRARFSSPPYCLCSTRFFYRTRKGNAPPILCVEWTKDKDSWFGRVERLPYARSLTGCQS